MNVPTPRIDWSAVAHDFSVDPSLVWLNNCGAAPPPTPAVEATIAFQRAWASRLFLAGKTEDGVHAACATIVAGLLNAAPDEIALVHNTNEGMGFVSQGLALRPGDRILLIADEYPSNVYPWEHWRARGVAIDRLHVGGSPGECLERFAAALQPTTRVASMTAVHWCTGMPLPLGAMGALCAERGVDFVVDASQGLGLVPLDVRAMGITALAASAWKWLMGPVGLGVLYVRRDRIAGLGFPGKGTGSVVNAEVYLPHRDELKPDATRFVTSTPNFADWVSFEASLTYLRDLGFAAVRARIHELGAALRERLRASGWSLASDAWPGAETAIVAASKPGLASAALVAGLARRGIIAADRLGRVRLAPHIHNHEGHFDATVRALDELARA